MRATQSQIRPPPTRAKTESKKQVFLSPELAGPPLRFHRRQELDVGSMRCAGGNECVWEEATLAPAGARIVLAVLAVLAVTNDEI